MTEERKKDPLHGKTLKAILTELVECYGWEEMSARIRINCFAVDPSVSSSLKFLRKTQWARNKVEDLYLVTHGHEVPVRKRPEQVEAVSKPAVETRKPKVNLWTGEPL